MRRPIHLAFALAAAMTTVIAAAQPSTHLTAAAGSRLVLQGSSNVAAWKCSGSEIDARMDIAASITKINDVIDRVEDGNIGVFMATPAAGRFPVPDFEMTIPVASLRCGKRQMERDLMHALKAEQFPLIRFRLVALRGAVQHDIDGRDYSAPIAGTLSLAGAQREITVNVRAERVARDRFRLRAELPLRMTDFGVTPPTALLGMVKARNELVVRFDLILQVRSGAGPKS